MKRHHALLLAAVVAVLSGACAGDDDVRSESSAPAATVEADWPVFGHDLANSRFNPDETVIGLDDVGDLDVAWEVDELAGVTGTPTVVDGVVYVGDYTGSVRAFDADSGESVWVTELDAGAVYGSPAIDGGRVFVGDQSGFLHALDRESGEVVWSQRAGEHASTIVFNSPVAVDGLVLVGVGSVENFTAPEDFTFQGSVTAYDQETGDQRWRAFTTRNDESDGAGVSIWSTPAVDVDRRVVYVGTGQAYETPAGPLSDSVLALSLDDGSLVWSHQYTEGDVRTFDGSGGGGPDADVGAGPNLFTIDDRDVVGAGDKAGRYKALDRDTGELVWSTDLTTGGVLGGVEATGAVADGLVYVGSNVGDEDSGSPTGVASLFALDAASGDIVWERELEGSIFGSPTVANGVVYQGTQLRVMYALDAESGEELWRHEVDGDVGGGPSVVDGTVYWGYGFWILERPDDPSGGLLAFTTGD